MRARWSSRLNVVPPDLGQGALELAAARGDLVRDRRQRQVGVGVAEPDHLERLAVEVPPSAARVDVPHRMGIRRDPSERINGSIG